MKMMLKVLSLAAILAASAHAALADQIIGDILLSGPGEFTVSGHAPNLVGSFTDLTGTKSVTNADDAPFTDFMGAPSGDIVFGNFKTTDGPGDVIVKITLASGETLSFTESSFGPVGPKTGSSGGSVLIQGTIADTGGAITYTPAQGVLDFSENGLLLNFTDDALSNVPAVPEPSSLMLLGTGLLTAVGVARRKFKA
jgi:hypothetical protein